MRYNKAGEVYCHNSFELRAQIDEAGLNYQNVYLYKVSAPEVGDRWIGEIMENISGDLVCHIEADTEKGVRDIVLSVGVGGQNHGTK